jgi:hypothetical protein
MIQVGKAVAFVTVHNHDTDIGEAKARAAFAAVEKRMTAAYRLTRHRRSTDAAPTQHPRRPGRQPGADRRPAARRDARVEPVALGRHSVSVLPADVRPPEPPHRARLLRFLALGVALAFVAGLVLTFAAAPVGARAATPPGASRPHSRPRRRARPRPVPPRRPPASRRPPPRRPRARRGRPSGTAVVATSATSPRCSAADRKAPASSSTAPSCATGAWSTGGPGCARCSSPPGPRSRAAPARR